MSKNVKIAIVAPVPFRVDVNLSYQQMVEKVREHWQKELDQVLPDKPDLIVIPEVCDRPADLMPEKVMEYYSVRGEQLSEFFAEQAKQSGAYITYPAVRQLKDGSYRNSIILFNRSGDVAGVYDKNHPTIPELERNILPGKQATVVECDFGRVGFAICFDLNFDELRLQYAEQSPDIILFASMYHGGDVVQGMWAYSSRAYLVSAVAPPACPSEIRNPFGQVVASTTNYFDFVVASVNLDYCLAHLDYNWERLSKLKRAYGEQVEIYDPGLVGSVMIISRTEQKTAYQFAKEFEIELLDDYFGRSRASRAKKVQ